MDGVAADQPINPEATLTDDNAIKMMMMDFVEAEEEKAALALAARIEAEAAAQAAAQAASQAAAHADDDDDDDDDATAQATDDDDATGQATEDEEGGRKWSKMPSFGNNTESESESTPQTSRTAGIRTNRIETMKKNIQDNRDLSNVGNYNANKIEQPNHANDDNGDSDDDKDDNDNNNDDNKVSHRKRLSKNLSFNKKKDLKKKELFFHTGDVTIPKKPSKKRYTPHNPKRITAESYKPKETEIKSHKKKRTPKRLKLLKLNDSGEKKIKASRARFLENISL